MRLFIGTPTQSKWDPEFGHSLAWTMSDLSGNPGQVKAVHHAWMDGTLLPDLRMDLARRAQEIGATHILWCDCDMKFGPTNVRALLKHDLDIVACNYIRRLPPHHMTAIGMNGAYTKQKTGLEEVLYAGMGLMLTKVSVFDKLPEPWFLMPWNEDAKEMVGEDVWFCKIAADHGFKTFIDHDASVGIGHVGKFIHMVEKPEPTLKLVKGTA
jgi:hypothetical protein